MSNALTCLDVGFAYGGRSVLRGVRMAAAAGRVTVLVGPSGTGKTTLLWILAGLLRPTTGRVVLAADATSPDAAPPFESGRARIGMVFQTPALWDHLTVRRHLDLVLAGSNLGQTERRRRVDRLLDQMGLASLAERRPGRMSGGERQRLAIARALVGGPEWLLLDEPLAHLDGPTRADVFDLLRGALAETRAGVVLATHNTDEAVRLADDVVVLLDGSVAQVGQTEQVYRRPVSLAAARALGPASEISGEARGGVLARDGTVILKGLAPERSGPQRLILRPEDLEFRPDPAGAARVARCERVGGAYHLGVEVAGASVWVRHAEGCPVGTTGHLALVRRG